MELDFAISRSAIEVREGRITLDGACAGLVQTSAGVYGAAFQAGEMDHRGCRRQPGLGRPAGIPLSTGSRDTVFQDTVPALEEQADVMPTYLVRTANLTLDEGQRQAVAAAITDAHGTSTGAPGYFAQVFFEAAAPAHFIGGKANKLPHVFVHGMIRAGRTAEQKRALLAGIADGVHAATGVGREDVWVYVQDIAAEQMIEFGRVLPPPGAEAEWRRGFSPEKAGALAAAGVALPDREQPGARPPER